MTETCSYTGIKIVVLFDGDYAIGDLFFSNTGELFPPDLG